MSERESDGLTKGRRFYLKNREKCLQRRRSWHAKFREDQRLAHEEGDEAAAARIEHVHKVAETARRRNGRLPSAERGLEKKRVRWRAAGLTDEQGVAADREKMLEGARQLNAEQKAIRRAAEAGDPAAFLQREGLRAGVRSRYKKMYDAKRAAADAGDPNAIAWFAKKYAAGKLRKFTK